MKRLILIIALMAILSTFLPTQPAEAGGWGNFRKVAEVIRARTSHQCWEELPADASVAEINRLTYQDCERTGVDDPD